MGYGARARKMTANKMADLRLKALNDNGFRVTSRQTEYGNSPTLFVDLNHIPSTATPTEVRAGVMVWEKNGTMVQYSSLTGGVTVVSIEADELAVLDEGALKHHLVTGYLSGDPIYKQYLQITD